RFGGPEANLADAVQRIEAERNSAPADRRDSPQLLQSQMPAWQQALHSAHLPLYDVHWPAAVVVAMPGGKNAGIRVGLADGRVLPLASPNAAIRRALKLHDVIFVEIIEAKGKFAERAELRVPPAVQGAALVRENKTGRILGMAGCSTAASRAARRKAWSGSARSPWKPSSTANACVIIPLFLARSRCGWSISPRFTRQLPTRARARPRTPSIRSSRTAWSSIATR